MRHRPQFLGAPISVIRPIEILIITNAMTHPCCQDIPLYKFDTVPLLLGLVVRGGETHSRDVAKIFCCINLTLSHYFWAQWLEAERHTAQVCVRIRLFFAFYVAVSQGLRYKVKSKTRTHPLPPPQPPLFSAHDVRIFSDAEEDARTSRQALQSITLTQALTQEGRPQLSVSLSARHMAGQAQAAGSRRCRCGDAQGVAGPGTTSNGYRGELFLGRALSVMSRSDTHVSRSAASSELRFVMRRPSARGGRRSCFLHNLIP
ncbi:unnamed protein product [Meganyctiphanes norvegica]|uniref:Uncharacterized protein n=1 Tax=Meganyctiphanes norvegica TaxID=48144 RepID=A0AAV2SSY3_MEGNR